LTRQNASGILRRKQLREAALDARGAACEICGCRERELLVFHHFLFDGDEDRRARTPTQMLSDIISGKDRKLILVDVACHARLHAGNAQLPAKYKRKRK
jgi:hypothetical protein